MIELRSAGKAATVAVLLLVVACSGDDDGGDAGPSMPPASTDVPVTTEPSSTVPPATDPPTTDPSTTRPTTTTTSPPPDPVVRSRIVVTGPEEIVFDWTTDQCEPEHIPDIAARAYRDAAGRVQLTIGHYVTYRMIGPSLDEVVTDCSTVQLRSDYDPDPSQFNDSEWIGAPYTLDGETVYAVVHNEYRGDTHGSARPGQCPSGQRLPCLDTSFTMLVSTDGGDTFDDITEPPGHLIATLPYRYLDDTVPSGIRQPSNIVRGPGDYFYLFGNVSDQPAEDQWVCAMRTDDLSDPSSWRFWDGAEFAGVWRNPYLESVDPDADKCAPLAFPQLSGGLNEGIVYDERLELFMVVGVTNHPSSADPRFGVYYSTSENLVDWSARELLLEVPLNATVDDPDNDTTHAYPSIIDPDSTSLNFETSDGRMYLYMSRFNFGGNSLDRDLLRWPIAVEDYTVEAPDWRFDDETDLEPSTGGWVAVNDLAPLTINDGVVELRPTATDPFIEATSLLIPAEYDRMVIRMRAPEGVDNFGQLFFATDSEPDWSETNSTGFPVIGTGDFVDYPIDLSDDAGWAGTIIGLRFDPVEGIDDDVDIDRIWFPVS